MSAELARRLIHGGAAKASVEAALFAAAEQGISLPEAVYAQFPEMTAILERALEIEDLPAVHTVRPATEIARRLPVGMCERLLSVPLKVDARSERVDVAAVDVLDPHVAEEFSFHLKMPVRVLRARYEELMAALDGLHTSGTFLPGLSRVLSGEAAAPEVREQPSDPPIPLVRKSIVPHPPRSELAATLQIELPPAPAVPVAVDAPAPPVPAVAVVANGAPAAAPGTPERSSEPILSLRRAKAEPSASPTLFAHDLPSSLAAIDASESAEQVLSAVVRALEPLKAVVLALRGASFVGRVGSASLAPDADVRSLAVRASGLSVLDRAVESGFHLGPLPFMEAHERLARLLGVSGKAEVYARSVLVSERPSSVIVVAGFRESTEASRRTDELARSAGVALERIVLRRKRG